jgi:hypothetical protein
VNEPNDERRNANDAVTAIEVVDAMRAAVCEHPAEARFRISSRRRHSFVCGLCGFDAEQASGANQK